MTSKHEMEIKKAKDAVDFAQIMCYNASYGPPSQEQDEDMRDARLNLRKKQDILDRLKAGR